MRWKKETTLKAGEELQRQLPINKIAEKLCNGLYQNGFLLEIYVLFRHLN